MKRIVLTALLCWGVSATYGQSESSKISQAEALAAEQLAAYNARNIEDFLRPYSDSVVVYNFPRELIFRGKEAMRKRYGKMFAETPDLHCELVNRIVLGNVAIDQEQVTRKKGEPLSRVIAIYTIRNDKIAEVTFIRPEDN